MASPKGFIALPLMGWVAVGVSVAFIALGAYAKIKANQLETCRAEHAAFVAQVKAVGEEQERKAKAQALANQKRKEESDRENQVNRNRIATLSRELRDARSRGSYLPPAAPGSPSPERAAFDRAELERTIQRLDDGISGLIAEGDKAVTDLNGLKEWASKP